MSADDAQQSESRRVGKHAKSSRQPFCGAFIEGFREELRTALDIDRLDQLHSVILTAVDTSVNVSTLIDVREEVCPDGCVQRPVLPRGGLSNRLLLVGDPLPARARPTLAGMHSTDLIEGDCPRSL